MTGKDSEGRTHARGAVPAVIRETLDQISFLPYCYFFPHSCPPRMVTASTTKITCHLYLFPLLVLAILFNHSDCSFLTACICSWRRLVLHLRFFQIQMPSRPVASVYPAVDLLMCRAFSCVGDGVTHDLARWTGTGMAAEELVYACHLSTVDGSVGSVGLWCL
jgi:hypothetical protein